MKLTTGGIMIWCWTLFMRKSKSGPSMGLLSFSMFQNGSFESKSVMILTTRATWIDASTRFILLPYREVVHILLIIIILITIT